MDNAYCRLCADSKPNCELKILQSDDEKQKINNKLIRLNVDSVDFDEDTLPNTICLMCIHSLDVAFEFVLGVDQAQIILRSLILGKEVKKEKLNQNTCSESEDCFSEPIESVFSIKETNVKVELSLVEPEAKSNGLLQTKNKTRKKQNKQSKGRKFGLNSIPESERDLTWDEYSWTCASCDTQFATFTELKLHSMQIHERCNLYKCTDCNIRKTRLNHFLKHIRQHRRYLKLSCHLCFEKLPNTYLIFAHNKTHIKSEYVCWGCNESFQNDEELNRHIRDFNTSKKIKEYPILQNVTDSLICNLCQKIFKNKHILNAHMLTHTDRKRSYTCHKCGRGFFNKYALTNHMVFHQDERPYKCEICKTAFKTRVHLRRHVMSHEDSKPYTCDECGRCFRSKNHLKDHSIIHTDMMPYICSYCGKGFNFKNLLVVHVRQHTGDKPYSCSECHREFTNWSNYNKHMKRRHGLDTSKKKITDVDPDTEEILEWKEKILKKRGPGKKKAES